MVNSEISGIKLDLLCAIKYLSDDRRAKNAPRVTDLGIFLRGSDTSRKKAFTHKYDLHGKYKSITNEEIQMILDECVKERLVLQNNGYILSKEGVSVIEKEKPEALLNPYMKGNATVERGEDYCYIGQYACYFRLDVFKKKTLNEILDCLEGYYAKVSPFTLQAEQIRAWTDCYKHLQNAFKEIPQKFHNLYVVFEYVLPTHNPKSKRSVGDVGIRADVVIVSSTATLVLEFKQRDTDFEGFVLQAKKYKTRLEKYHAQAQNMRNSAVLVLSKARKYLKKHEDVISCSSDYLSDIVQIIFENDSERHTDIKGFLHSPFTDLVIEEGAEKSVLR